MKVTKIKVASVWIDENEKVVTKGDKTFHIRNYAIKVADDCKDYAGKWMRGSFFGDEKRSSQSKADYFKSQNEGKEIILNVEEQPYTDKNTGEDKVGLKFKLLSKKEKELAEQFLK